MDGTEIEVGRHTYGHEQITVRHWGEAAALKIGAFCSVADRVQIFLGGNHRVDWVSTYPFAEFADRWPTAKGIEGHPATNGDVVIGNDVWIGSAATILSGVTIGDGACIGADSTVTKDVRPYAIVAGNPARELRLRFAPETIEKLLAIRWWEWPDDRIAASVDLLSSDQIERFIEARGGRGSGKKRWGRLLGSRQ
jgi:acetyltransferase-like isoleucine patch superfamily enzyme